MNRPGFVRGFDFYEGGAMTSKTTNNLAPEIRERAVSIMFSHERDHPSKWAAVVSIAEKISCVPQALSLTSEPERCHPDGVGVFSTHIIPIAGSRDVAKISTYATSIYPLSPSCGHS